MKRSQETEAAGLCSRSETTRELGRPGFLLANNEYGLGKGAKKTAPVYLSELSGTGVA
jgi:hypothetical protein